MKPINFTVKVTTPNRQAVEPHCTITEYIACHKVVVHENGLGEQKIELGGIDGTCLMQMFRNHYSEIRQLVVENMKGNTVHIFTPPIDKNDVDFPISPEGTIGDQIRDQMGHSR